jgi:hypothetical protein
LQEHPLAEERYRVWRTNAWDTLKAAFGEKSGHLNNFTGKSRKSLDDETERRNRLSQQIAFLEAVMEEFPPVDILNLGTEDQLLRYDDLLKTTGQDLFSHEKLWALNNCDPTLPLPKVSKIWGWNVTPRLSRKPLQATPGSNLLATHG